MSWKPKKQQLLIILMIGILLAVTVVPDSPKKKLETENKETESQFDYEEKMERKLEEVLSKVEGVGKVKVMITLQESSEKILEKDEESIKDSIEEKDAQGGIRSTFNNQYKETTIYKGREEEQKPYIKKELSPKIEGVVVIAQGGENKVAVKNMTEAVQALFEVEPHKIKIMKMIQNK